MPLLKVFNGATIFSKSWVATKAARLVTSKFDQITAIRWSLSVCTDILATTIKNCFNHTRLFANTAIVFMSSEEFKDMEGDKEVEEEQRDLEQDMKKKLEQLPLRVLWLLMIFPNLPMMKRVFSQSSVINRFWTQCRSRRRRNEKKKLQQSKRDL